MKLLAVFIVVPIIGIIALALFMPRPEVHTFNSNGVKIAYTVEGKGDPVILIHGFLSSAEINWRWPGTIAALARDHQVIALDVRGHGASDKPVTEGDYGLEMVEDVVRLMDHLKIKKAQAAGYSMGGMIAMKLAVTHPDRVSAVALCGMGWLKQGSPLQAFWSSVKARRSDGHFSACAKSFAALAVSEKDVRSVKLPVTMIVGDADIVKALYVDSLHQARPDWPLTIIRGADHLSCVAKPEFRAEVVKWADKQSPVAGAKEAN